jgi:hypothetical protein
VSLFLLRRKKTMNYSRKSDQLWSAIEQFMEHIRNVLHEGVCLELAPNYEKLELVKGTLTSSNFDKNWMRLIQCLNLDDDGVYDYLDIPEEIQEELSFIDEWSEVKRKFLLTKMEYTEYSTLVDVNEDDWLTVKLAVVSEEDPLLRKLCLATVSEEVEKLLKDKNMSETPKADRVSGSRNSSVIPKREEAAAIWKKIAAKAATWEGKTMTVPIPKGKGYLIPLLSMAAAKVAKNRRGNGLEPLPYIKFKEVK